MGAGRTRWWSAPWAAYTRECATWRAQMIALVQHQIIQSSPTDLRARRRTLIATIGQIAAITSTERDKTMNQGESDAQQRDQRRSR